MKFRWVCLLLPALVPLLVWSQGTQSLVDKTAAAVAEVMANRYNPRVTVVSFENHTELSDLAAQKFYQLMVSRLESPPRRDFIFFDRMLAFNNGSGRFNSQRLDDINFLIALKLIRSGARIGVGITVFSRRLDRMVAVKYVSESIPAAELRLLELHERAFATSGFAMAARMESDRNLMDVCSHAEPDGSERHYFFLPDKVEVFEWRSRRMLRLLTLPLEWSRPTTPARHVEGHILVFHNNAGTWLTAGTNTSARCLVFLRRDGRWEEQEALDFVPIRHLVINDNFYLAGMRYAGGLNYFRGGLILMPLTGGRPDRSRVYEKPLPDAYAIDFSAREGRLAALHLVDREYRYRVFTTDFESSTADERLRGAALAALGTDWVAVSDYSRGKDRVFFFKSGDGGLREAYEGEFTHQEIRFISPGKWEGKTGFWICLAGTGNTDAKTELQFWRKAVVPEAETKQTTDVSGEVEDVTD